MVNWKTDVPTISVSRQPINRNGKLLAHFHSDTIAVYRLMRKSTLAYLCARTQPRFAYLCRHYRGHHSPTYMCMLIVRITEKSLKWGTASENKASEISKATAIDSKGEIWGEIQPGHATCEPLPATCCRFWWLPSAPSETKEKVVVITFRSIYKLHVELLYQRLFSLLLDFSDHSSFLFISRFFVLSFAFESRSDLDDGLDVVQRLQHQRIDFKQCGSRLAHFASWTRRVGSLRV